MIGFSPYLSIVTVSRNDNHGGELLKRMQLFIDGIFEHSTFFQLPTELIIVEWNAPDEKKKLAEELYWNKEHSYCEVRIIEVNSDIHKHYRKPDKLPLHQMIGKNVGVQRARAPFILATNIDILFSKSLFQYLAKRQLESDKVYRAERYDIDHRISVNMNFEEKQRYCKNNVIRKYKKEGTFSTSCATDSELFGATEGWTHNSLGRKMVHPFTNACGDFQLMSRKKWIETKGYPEFDIYPVHMDSLLQFICLKHGIQEEILNVNMNIYHIDHEGSWSPATERAILHKFSENQIPSLSNVEMYALVEYMFKHQSFSFNHNNWGLNELKLPEWVLKSGEDIFTAVPANQEQTGEGSWELACDTDKWIKRLPTLVNNMLTRSTASFEDWVAAMHSGSGDIHSFDLEKKQIYIFGTGNCYQYYVRPVLEQFEVDIECFIDNDQNKWGQEVDQIPINSPDVLSHIHKEEVFILVASSYYGMMKHQLECMGFLEGKHFVRAWIFSSPH
ncbi:hypothetical protein [Marinicrinis sediminis]|uniref:Glycosyltransferase 2-like domain-containing protein n=1 Tax=Marinicrinis sediminis TaxID=1652465 RepID=A0ABW5RB98_9BACL